MNRVYTGRRVKPEEKTVSDIEVKVQDAQGERMLPLEPSLKLRNHSPTGFAWGYGGSGPAQLALAILLDFTGDEKTALEYYQDFKWDFVGGWGDEWSIGAPEIEQWLERVVR